MAENYLLGAGDRSAIQIISEDVIGEKYLLGAGDRSANEVLANDVFRTRQTGKGYSYLTPDFVRTDSDGSNMDESESIGSMGFSTVQKSIVAIAGFALFSALVGQLFTFEVGS